MKKEIAEKSLFMICKELNDNAQATLPPGYSIRNCRQDELDIWKEMPFDDKKLAKEYDGFMTDFFHTTYGNNEELFYKKCLFVCDENDIPIGTCFIWKSYQKINTVHWFKVLKDYENKGIGRALLSTVMKGLNKEDYPVYLHTHPTSYRAIKLYSDMGFQLLSDEVIGNRKNHLEECLPFLKKMMPEKDFNHLKIVSAPKNFLEIVASSNRDEF